MAAGGQFYYFMSTDSPQFYHRACDFTPHNQHFSKQLNCLNFCFCTQSEPYHKTTKLLHSINFQINKVVCNSNVLYIKLQLTINFHLYKISIIHTIRFHKLFYNNPTKNKCFNKHFIVYICRNPVHNFNFIFNNNNSNTRNHQREIQVS